MSVSRGFLNSRIAQPPRPRAPRSTRATNAVASRVKDPTNAPAHRLAARPATVARVTPIIDLAGGAKGVVDEGSSNLTLQTTTASGWRVGHKLQIRVRSPTVGGVGKSPNRKAPP